MELNTMEPKAVVEAYWQEMQSNDFAKAASWLGDDFSVTGPNRENGLWGERILLRSIVATPQLACGASRLSVFWHKGVRWSVRCWSAMGS
ncbi:hypothetical protein ACSZMZ_05620 [Aeromonas veronii]